jgi:hypothetical protein
MGALFAPLGLMAVFFGRRKNGSKWNALLVILMFAIVVGMMLTACDPNNDNSMEDIQDKHQIAK